MPMYTYRCPECGHSVIRKHRVELRDHDAPWHYDGEHEACPMKRVIEAPSIQFKGPGFYSTDK